MAAFAVGAERIQAVGVKGRHAPKGISDPGREWPNYLKGVDWLVDLLVGWFNGWLM